MVYANTLQTFDQVNPSSTNQAVAFFRLYREQQKPIASKQKSLKTQKTSHATPKMSPKTWLPGVC